MKYSDKLPRSVIRAEERCQHLDSNGERCEENFAMEVFQFESREDNGYGEWHIVYFCKEHSKLRRIKE